MQFICLENNCEESEQFSLDLQSQEVFRCPSRASTFQVESGSFIYSFASHYFYMASQVAVLIVFYLLSEA